MDNLDPVDWEILNATADDWEDLGQICQQVKRHGGDRVHNLSGELIADRILTLVENGLLAARLADGEGPMTEFTDPGYVWHAWFAMTPVGRALWSTSEHAPIG